MTPNEALAQVAEKLPELLAELPHEEPPAWPLFVHGRPAPRYVLQYSPFRELLDSVLRVLRLK